MLGKFSIPFADAKHYFYECIILTVFIFLG